MDDFFEKLIGFFWPVNSPENHVMDVKDPPKQFTVVMSSSLQQKITGSWAISLDQLRQAMPHLPVEKAQIYHPYLCSAMNEFQINNRLRVCYFLGQVAHESTELHYFEELGRPSYFQRYEGRKDLGNTKPGDGYMFRGRGPIQLTGRGNYRKVGKILGIDLENNPDLASSPEVAFRIACYFWMSHNLNKLADQQNYKLITLLINGGYRGWEDRVKYRDIMLSVITQVPVV